MFLKPFMTAWTEVVAAMTLVVLINSKGSQTSVRDQGRKTSTKVNTTNAVYIIWMSEFGT